MTKHTIKSDNEQILNDVGLTYLLAKTFIDLFVKISFFDKIIFTDLTKVLALLRIKVQHHKCRIFATVHVFCQYFCADEIKLSVKDLCHSRTDREPNPKSKKIIICALDVAYI